MKTLLIFKKLFSKKPKPQNYGTVKKRFLSLEKGKIDKKIESALNLEDYGYAILLKGKMDKVERKLNKAERKEKKTNEKNRRLQ
jgi:hypothetical protein